MAAAALLVPSRVGGVEETAVRVFSQNSLVQSPMAGGAAGSGQRRPTTRSSRRTLVPHYRDSNATETFLLSNFSQGVSICVMAGYSLLLAVELALRDDLLHRYQLEFWGTSAFCMLLFLGVAVARMFSFGREYAQRVWTVADLILNVFAVVILFVVPDYSAMIFDNSIKVLSCVNVIFLFICAERALRHVTVIRPRLVLRRQYNPISSPLEQCIEDLRQVVDNGTMNPESEAVVLNVVDVLCHGDLFRPVQDALVAGGSQGIDEQMAQWMNEAMRADMIAPVRQKRRSAGSQEFVVGSGSYTSRASFMSQEGVPGAVPAGGTEAVKKLHTAMSMRIMELQQLRGYGAREQMLSLIHSPANKPERSRHRTREAGAITESHSPEVEPTWAAPRSASARLWDVARRIARLRRLMKGIGDWTFDVFKVATTTHGWPLQPLVQHMLHIHDVSSQLRLDPLKLRRLVHRIEAGYGLVPYHNSTHAADVVQTTHYFLVQPFLLPFVSPMHKLACTLGAACHDYAHPGTNNAFEIATRSTLAIRYNDIAVLENMHASSLFQLLCEEGHDLLCDFAPPQFKEFRSLAIQLILGTDMAKHFEDLAKLKNRIAQLELTGNPAHILLATPIDMQFALQMVVHTADVSNPAKPLTVYRQHVDAVMQEFYAQGDKERARGLPISTFYDRNSPNIPKFQLGFMDFIVGPIFSEWAKIIPDVAQIVVPLLQANRRYWDGKAKKAEAAAAAMPVTLVPGPVVAMPASSPVLPGRTPPGRDAPSEIIVET